MKYIPRIIVVVKVMIVFVRLVSGAADPAQHPTAGCCHLANLVARSKSYCPKFQGNSCNCLTVVLISNKKLTL